MSSSSRRTGAGSWHCSRPLLHLSPALRMLILSAIILPSSSSAQDTGPPSPSPTTSGFATSTLTSILTSKTADDYEPEEPDGLDDGDKRHSNGMFGYYFIIVIAVVIVLFIIGMLWFSKRKKQKAAIMRSNSQRALAQDVEGLRTRIGRGTGSLRRPHPGGSGEVRQMRPDYRTEGLGLNERGEAPPPYKPGARPPSIGGSIDGSGSGVEETESLQARDGGTEMNPITNLAGQEPPDYGAGRRNMYANLNNGGNGNGSWDDLNMARPAAVTASPRPNVS